jgi:hypothetical protein
MKLQHPDNTGRPIDVDDERADLLKLNGWAEVAAPKSDDKK